MGLHAVTIAKDSGKSSDDSHVRNTVSKYSSFMGMLFPFFVINGYRKLSDLRDKLSHRTKKAPRRNEGLGFKALKKLNEVNLPNWLDVVNLAFAA